MTNGTYTFRRLSLIAVLVAGSVPGCGSVDGDAATSDASRPEQAQQTQPSSAPAAPIVIEARGREFKWRFFHAGPDGQPATGDEALLGNELPVPAEADVILVLTSEDYVYTLNVPDGRVEAAVPELTHVVQFTSPKSGTHEFVTDPMCGLRYFHDDVLGTMKVVSRPEFDRLTQSSPIVHR